MGVPFDWDKFKNLVHYICSRTSDPALLGAVKLNKILWFTDVLAYAKTGRSVTGVAYIKKQNGPVAKGFHEAVEQLRREGSIAVSRVDAFGYDRVQCVALTEPDVTGFTADDIRLVESVRESISYGHTAVSISELTHDEIWGMAADGEEIPLHTVFVARKMKPDLADIRWAREVA